MALLAAGLRDLTFESGLPIPGAGPTSPSPAASTDPTHAADHSLPFPWLLQAILAIGLILLLIIFLVTLFRKANKKRIGLSAAVLALLVLLLLWLPQLTPPQPANAIEEPFVSSPKSFVYSIAPIGEPPVWLLWLVIAGLFMAAASLGGWLLMIPRRQSRKKDRLGLEAAAAIQAIAEGRDIKNVIIRCYLQMERVIQEELGFERKEAVTPREFERYLVACGIPDAPVIQLTRLFETARYGYQVPDAQIEQEALGCLSTIHSACLKTKGGKG